MTTENVCNQIGEVIEEMWELHCEASAYTPEELAALENKLKERLAQLEGRSFTPVAYPDPARCTVCGEEDHQYGLDDTGCCPACAF